MIKFIERPIKEGSETVTSVSLYEHVDSIQQPDTQRWKYRGTFSLPREEWADLRETIKNSDLSGIIYQFEEGA